MLRSKHQEYDSDKLIEKRIGAIIGASRSLGHNTHSLLLKTVFVPIEHLNALNNLKLVN